MAFFAFFLFLSGTAHAQVRRASARPEPPLEERLAREPGFLRLLHYRPSSFGGLESDVDDADFFLAPTGRTQPVAELKALLDAVRAAEPATARRVSCLFPARVEWLAQHLELPPAQVDCPELDDFERRLDVASVSLVYAANSLRRPESAIGHSFLLLRPRTGEQRDARGQLAGTSVDYLAKTDTTNPLAYAYKGVTGQFVGRFEFLPQAEKFAGLLERDDRDLWEYELDLSPAELRRFTRHLYELARTRVRYFYLTDNCSYQALSALEAAAPRLRLTDRTKFVVLPIDTVRAVNAEPNLVRAARYYPANSTRGRDALAHSSPPELGEPPELAEASQRAGAWVSDVGAPNPVERNPARAHGPLRVSLGTGFSSTKQGFYGASFRLVLHDLLDAPIGYPELIQAQLLGLALRYAPAESSFTVERVTFVDLLYLAPLDEPSPLSFRVRALGDRLRDDGCSSGDCFVHGLDLGLGLTVATPTRAQTVFALMTTSALFSDDVVGVGGSFVRWSVGPELGWRARLGEGLVALVSARLLALPFQAQELTFDVEAGLRARLHRDVALGVEGRAQPRAVEGSLSSYFYF